MDDARKVLMDALGKSTGWDSWSRDIGVDEQLAALAAHGYAVVKLPEMESERDEQQVWKCVSRDKYPAEVLIGADGRIRMNAVSNPIATPEHALSLAAALIAAAQHMQEDRS